MRALPTPLCLLGLLLAACAADDDDSPRPDAGIRCGNELKEAGESCDGSDLGGVTCLDLGWTMGTLGCREDCTFDIDRCVGGGPSCGNWVVEWGEDCDTHDLGGATCESIGFAPGTLGCRADCTFDRTDCGAPATCGNQVIDGNEECDGPDLGEATCQSLGFDMGDLGCAANCAFNVSYCTNARCGNGVQEDQEECDGDDLDNHDCVMLGHNGGTLSCSDLCLFDESQCN